MDNKKIIISSDKELKIFMSPLRQKIIKLLSYEGKPVTSKYIADKLRISPSSAQHHIKQLISLEIIEYDHTEVINGISAKYLKLTDKTISLGQNICDELSEERDILARNMIYEKYEGFHKLVKKYRSTINAEHDINNKLGDVLSGIVHLTNVEADELYEMINSFFKSHSKSYEKTHPYEYALIVYRADLNDDKGADILK